ncbi:MAG TPA: Fe2+-dependent dioxygenase [Stenomitos sp.]
MFLTLDAVLNAEELEDICKKLAVAEFADGKSTAGWHAQLVKHNQQLAPNDPYWSEHQARIKAALNRHPLFQPAVQPDVLHTLLLSRYEAGMSYGSHVDNALMGHNENGQRYRSDISWTLFLSPPDSYVGGELVIEGSEGERQIKLAAGSAVIYPSSYLHRVEPIVSGVRLAAVGWVQSLVRDPAQREILFDLEAARRSLFRQHGKTPEFDLISKTHANLLRRWADC